MPELIPLAPTAKLRWVLRDYKFVLEQWWAQDVPAYLRSESQGEWREIEQVTNEKA